MRQVWGLVALVVFQPDTGKGLPEAVVWIDGKRRILVMSPLPSAVVTVLSRGDLPQSLSLFVASFTWILLFLHPVCPVIDSLVCSGGLVKGQATSEMLLPFPAWLRWGGTRAGQLSVFHTDVFLVSPHPGLIFGVFRVFFLVCLYSYLMWKNSYWILWFNIKLSALIPVTCWHTADTFESRYTHLAVFLHLNQSLYSSCCMSWIPHSLFANEI